VEGIVILLGLRRGDGRRAGSRGLRLVHALPEGVLGLLRRTLDCEWAHGRCLDHGRNHHACGRRAFIRGDSRGTIVIITAVIVADGLELSPELTLLFFSSLDLGALSGKSSLFLCRVLLGGRTTLLLFGPLQLAGFDLFFEGAERGLLFFALPLQFAFLPGFFVPREKLASVAQVILVNM
jgi:hypothetical protein